MSKQTKNIITREWLEKELYFYNTAALRTHAVACVSMSFLLLPLIILCVVGLCNSSLHIFFNLFLSIWSVIVFGAPLFIQLFSIHTLISERNLLKRGEFDIVTREVLYKSEKMVRRHIEEYLHFNDFKEVSVGSLYYTMGSDGEPFYIVYFKGKNEIKLLYPTKMYEYKGEN